METQGTDRWKFVASCLALSYKCVSRLRDIPARGDTTAESHSTSQVRANPLSRAPPSPPLPPLPPSPHLPLARATLPLAALNSRNFLAAGNTETFLPRLTEQIVRLFTAISLKYRKRSKGLHCKGHKGQRRVKHRLLHPFEG